MKPADTRFHEQVLSAQLQQLLAASQLVARRFIVGFSGGLDSTCLLLAMSRIRDELDTPVSALHFDHGLHPDSTTWLEHCATTCKRLEVPLRAITGSVASDAPGGIEAAAREFRYQALESRLAEGDVFLTAHHASDQAETLLINLLRGSGTQGLAAIPALRPCGRGWIARPLLNIQRRAMVEWLEQQTVAWDGAWIEDPSNRDERFDRNFIRHRVIPLLEERWPATVRSLHRSAALARSESAAMALMLEAELSRCGSDECTFPITVLRERPLYLRASLLRHWIVLRTGTAVPYQKLQEFLEQLGNTETNGNAEKSADNLAEIRWAHWLVKRYRDRLWLQRQSSSPPCPAVRWESLAEVDLGEALGKVAIDSPGEIPPHDWRIGPRREGDRLQVRAEGPRRRIKHLMNEAGIPTWMRRSIPVLYRDDTALAIGDWHLAPELVAWLARHNASYRWEPREPALIKLSSLCRIAD